ncbi:MAG: glycine cleavage system protein GcvH [Simkaniaceae bacterium]|nr:glycine cleavage system protein GcvH [Simkaniaceae bacterium]
MKYSRSHEWAFIEGSKARIGLTEYGRKELGEIVYVEFPEIGHLCHPGDEVAILESTKAAADFSTPLKGKVVRINSQLVKDSDLINQSPEESGWLFEIELSHPEEAKALLSKEEYLALLTLCTRQK